MTRKLKGIAAAPGVAIAPVVQFHTTLDHIPMWKVAAGAVAAEQARLSGAVAEVTQSLIALQKELAGAIGKHDVRIYDDDDPILKNGTAFTNVELTAMSAGRPAEVENGLRFGDTNKRLVIRSTGFGPQGTQATLEQMLVPVTMPALLVDGDLTMRGNARVDGAQGSR